jgi:hypothetical protein
MQAPTTLTSLGSVRIVVKYGADKSTPSILPIDHWLLRRGKSTLPAAYRAMLREFEQNLLNSSRNIHD